MGAGKVAPDFASGGTVTFLQAVVHGLALLVVLTVVSAEDPGSPAARAGKATARGLKAGKAVEPPPMPRRAIAPSTNALPGRSILLADGSIKFTLFIPDRWRANASGESALAVHFHTVGWFAIQEHLRRRSRQPLVCFQLGEGSTVYRQAFEDTNRLARVLRLVEEELKKDSTHFTGRVTSVDLSSFSAGYGAIRELLKSPDCFKLIQRVVLLDSMYAAYAGEGTPMPEQIEVWVPFARAAMKGQKTFVFTHSAVPTAKYASSATCAQALLTTLGATREAVEPGSLPAADQPEFPLRYRSNVGNLHVWGYGGEDAGAHLTHVRHMADVWMALDNGSDELLPP